MVRDAFSSLIEILQILVSPLSKVSAVIP